MIDFLKTELAFTKHIKTTGAYMMQALYSARHIKHYKKYFSNYSTRLALNFPPANIYTCRKVES